MGKDDDIWGLIGGIALGAIGLAVLSNLSNPKCPECKGSIKKGISVCPHCGTYLEWK